MVTLALRIIKSWVCQIYNYALRYLKMKKWNCNKLYKYLNNENLYYLKIEKEAGIDNSIFVSSTTVELMESTNFNICLHYKWSN